jgi:hypothetical protein
VAKKAVNAYDELHKILPEGTVIKIDPPTTYKWNIIASMFGITDVNKLRRYSTVSEGNYLFINRLYIVFVINVSIHGYR